MGKNTLLVAAVVVLIVGGYALSNYGFGGGASTAYAIYADTLKSGAEKASAGAPAVSVEYRLAVLTDKSCASCKTDDIVSYLKEIFPSLKIVYVELSSSAGEKLVKKYGLSTVPAYVLNLDVESSQNFKLVEKAFTKVGDAYIVNLDDEYVGERL